MARALLVLYMFALVVAIASAAAPRTKTVHHSHRFLVAMQLVQGLRGTPIARQAWVLERVSYEEQMNPFFVVGAAGTESSVWRAPCSSNPMNGWGMSSCGSGWYVPHFQTWESAFRFYERYIKRIWPHARTPYELYGYCGCGESYWGSKTIAWIRQLFGDVPTGLAYP